MSREKKMKFVFAGGGTGGHLFPAVAVANKIKEKLPEAEILFIGTKSKIEGRVIPKLGYKFSSIWIKGFSRKFTLENLLFPIKLIVSIMQSLIINMKFNPSVAIGSGGYVSGPAIFGASVMGAKVILLEQNSFPGITTRLLEKRAEEIHVSFEDSKKYFRDKNKVHFTGNPVRQKSAGITKEEALKNFQLSADKKTVLVLGGSLGAASINKAVAANIKILEEESVQVIWQTGANYFESYKNLKTANVKVLPFIEDMNSAYAACDILIARAGATTIAELTVLGIAAILVPSPNVAGNHQYFNAKSLADKNAAVLAEDKNISAELFPTVKNLLSNELKLNELKINAMQLGKPEASNIIAEKAISYAKTI